MAQGTSGIEVRREALRILERVSGGAHSDALLDAVAVRFAEERDRALLRELVLGVLRNRTLLDAAIAERSTRPLDRIDAPVRELLRIAAYQMLCLDRVPAPAAVDTAVELAKRASGRSTAGFVNGVLRALGRDLSSACAALEAAVPDSSRPDDLARGTSHPEWFARRLLERLGPVDTLALLEAHNRVAPVSLLATQGPASLHDGPHSAEPPDPAHPDDPADAAAALSAALETEGIVTKPSRWVPGALRVVSGAATRTAVFAGGRALVQDEAAMLVARLAAAPPGGLVADLCAAPGGKSLALVAAAGATAGLRVIACDRQPARMRRLEDNARRVGARSARGEIQANAESGRNPAGALELVVADANAPPLPGNAFDVVLVDAPCTGTGVIRRHPEIRWRVGSGDAAVMSRRQRALLAAAAPLVKPGGALVYAVCSIEDEECGPVIEAFLSENERFSLVDPHPFLPNESTGLVTSDGCLRTWPHRDDLDGHFAARLRRDS